MSLWRTVCGLFIAVALLSGPPAHAQSSEKRIALVIGNGAYQDGALATPANDAGLIAQTLQAAGFDVVGARDLDTATLRSSLREFLDKASASGPDTVALVYYVGYGLQFEGENYLVPVDARIARDADVPLAAVRLSDLVRPLATLPLKARIVVLDAARANPFARSDQPLAGGLALMQPDPGLLIAFNAAPGTIAPEGKDYGAYATALSEMIKEGGLQLDELFERVRLRTSELTAGAEIAWYASRVQVPFQFFERTAAAPPEQTRFAELRNKPIRDFDARDAYLAALTRDTMRGYEDFLASYPGDPLAKRVRAILAARREAIVWRESAVADTPDAYWSYLRRYPRGPHAGDARRRLTHFAVALEPPAAFTALDYDVPPPPPDEIVYVERPVVYFADPVYALPPPPPIPVFFLPPQPVYFVDLPPPPPPVVAFVLPIPIYHPVPEWVERPAYVAPPPVNIVNVNIHNRVVVNPAAQTVVVTNAQGRELPPLPAALMPPNPAPNAAPVPQPAQPGALQSAQQLIQAHPITAAAIAATATALPAAVALRARQQQAQPPHGPVPAAPASQTAPPAGLPAVAPQGQRYPRQSPQPAQPLAARPSTPQLPAAQPSAAGLQPQPHPPAVPAGAKPLPVPTAPAAPDNPAQRLAAPPAAAPQAAQPVRAGTPPVAADPRMANPQAAAPSRPVAGSTAPRPPLPGGTVPTGRPTAAPQPKPAPQVTPAQADGALRAAAQQAERQRAQQAAIQAQQQRAQAQQQAQIQQQRAAQAAQQQAQQRAAQQAQQQRAAQAAQQQAMQAQQRAAQQAQMQQQLAAQAAQQRAMQAQQRAAIQAQQRAQQMAQPPRGPQLQRKPHCEPGHPECR